MKRSLVLHGAPPDAPKSGVLVSLICWALFRMNSYRIATLATLLVAASTTGCDFLSMEKVPTEEIVRRSMGQFLVKPDQIKGKYQNLDVDSLVFHLRFVCRQRHAILEPA
jgi:hypothetical protein